MAFRKRQNAPFPWMSRWHWENDAGRARRRHQTCRAWSTTHSRARLILLESQFQAVGLAKQWDLWAIQSWRTESVERMILPGFQESCSLTEQTVEAREGLKVCLLFPDTLFTVGWFPFGRAHCKRRRSQRFCELDLYRITVFFPGLLTDTIS